MAVYKEWYDDTKAFPIIGLWQPAVGVVPGTTVGPYSQWLYNDKGGTRPDTTTMSGYALFAEASLDGGVTWLRSGPDILTQSWIEAAITGIDNTGSAGMPAQATDYVKLGAGRTLPLSDIPKNCGRRITYRIVLPLGAGNVGVDWRIVPDIIQAPLISPGDINATLTPVAFNAANFSANVGTWTVDAADQVVFRFGLISKYLAVIAASIVNTNVSGSPVQLKLKIPLGYTAVTWTDSIAVVRNAGVYGAARVMASGDSLYFYSPAGAAGSWTNTTGNDTDVRVTILFQIN